MPMSLQARRYGVYCLMLLCLVLLSAVLDARHAEAGGYRGGSSFRSTPSFRPAPRPVVINRTTVVRQTVNQAPASSGMGSSFMGSMLGGAVGAGVANAVMNDHSTPTPAAAPQPLHCLTPDQKVVPCPAVEPQR